MNPTVAVPPRADDHAARRATSTSTTSGRPTAASRRSTAGRSTPTPRRSSATRPAARRDATVNVLAAVRRARLQRPASSLRNRMSYGVYDKFYQNVFPGRRERGGHAGEPSRPTTTRPTATNLFNQTDLRCARGTGCDRPHAAGGRGARPAGHRQLPQHRLLHARRPERHHGAGAAGRRRRSRCRSSSGRARPTPTTTASRRWPPSTCRTRSRCRDSSRRSSALRYDALRRRLHQQPHRTALSRATTGCCRRASA